MYVTVIIGGPGSGKSGYGMSIIDIKDTLKLGIPINALLQAIHLTFGNVKRHELDNRKVGISYKRTCIENIIDDIKKSKKPILLLDDWLMLFYQRPFYSEKQIEEKIKRIFNEFKCNERIKKVIIVDSDFRKHLPFRLYKRRALWHKLVFKLSDKVIKMEYGIPITIK